MAGNRLGVLLGTTCTAVVDFVAASKAVVCMHMTKR